MLPTFSRLSPRCRSAGVAQLVEQLTCNQPVGGSTPLASSIRCPHPAFLHGFQVRIGWRDHEVMDAKVHIGERLAAVGYVGITSG